MIISVIDNGNVMKKITLFLLTLLSFFFSLSVCAYEPTLIQQHVGKIKVNNSLEVHVYPLPLNDSEKATSIVPRVVLEGQQLRIKHDPKTGTLSLGGYNKKPWWACFCPCESSISGTVIDVYVPVPISAVQATGASSVCVTSKVVDVNKMRLETEGVSRIDFAGSTQHLFAKTQGTSSLYLQGQATQLHVVSRNVSSVTVKPDFSNDIYVEARDNSKIDVRGNPTVSGVCTNIAKVTVSRDVQGMIATRDMASVIYQ